MEFFATCNGIPVHISDSKKGDKILLLLHGYLETLYVWQDFVKILPADVRIISIDLPGHGLSGSHESINSLDFCADVVRDVLKKCNVDKCWIMGHSMGGYIAIESTKKYPELFSGLILMHSTPYPDSPEKIKDRDREIALIKQAKLPVIAKMGIPKMFAQDNLRRFDEKIFEIIELTETHDPEGIVASVEGLKARPDNLPFLESAKLPLLIFFGNSDYHIPIEKANQLAASLPAAKSVFLPFSGHNGFLEEPEVVKDELVKFMTL
ncbi:MAG: alpha/beta hydrolase [Bacteroidales bacterium]|jgi:pimeloyl-ACP methyl ester carboxylesterase|nr:alpha/beta hydrolase [Bacteroidales bacterium]